MPGLALRSPMNCSTPGFPVLHWPPAVLCLVVQSCPRLCDPMGYSPPVSSVHGIFQASGLEWVAISFSRGFSRPRHGTYVSCISCIAGRFFTAEPLGKPKAGLVVLNSLNFCLSGKLLISQSNVNESLVGYSILGYRFFPFITLKILCHSLWLVEFLWKNQVIS